MLLAGITQSQVVAICAVGTLALGLGLALNSWLKDRRSDEVADKKRDDSRYEQLHDELTQFRISMVGTPGDPSHGIPGVDGFTQRQESHNRSVDKAVAALTDQVTTLVEGQS